jgi:hypothetical protein
MILLTINELREHVTTDLSDAALQRILDAAEGEIISRYGPHANPATPLTVILAGERHRLLQVARPLDAAHPVTITEENHAFLGGTIDTLAADDWRAWHGGRSLERLVTGTHPRYGWGHHVTLTYVPVNDNAQRTLVLMDLAKMDVSAASGGSWRVGEIQFTATETARSDRDRVMATLAGSGFAGAVLA